ncbi:MAG: two-component system, chemotaxis family, chemotaxis protein CheY, partial [Pseudomonadota bacterium]|nr:two-component system, chemotaxis family, chemotaxis protein CheY [Pseudomonadota bacterium]
MKRLLIVDDSNIIRSRIARIMGNPRLPDIQIVGLAKDGAEAVAICRRS